MKIHMKLDLMYWKGVLRTAHMNSMKACRSTLARPMTCSDDTTNSKSISVPPPKNPQNRLQEFLSLSAGREGSH